MVYRLIAAVSVVLLALAATFFIPRNDSPTITPGGVFFGCGNSSVLQPPHHDYGLPLKITRYQSLGANSNCGYLSNYKGSAIIIDLCFWLIAGMVATAAIFRKDLRKLKHHFKVNKLVQLIKKLLPKYNA